MNNKITFRSLDALRAAVAQKKNRIRAIEELSTSTVDDARLADILSDLDFDVKKKLCMSKHDLT
ncbi:hypothetical protein [Methylicorpusculum sp.]|uniref:hypothetical protein n=1 Tax=Methylicorpusculum sp. TaxID=2713644 RepID=UPI002AB99EE1|nr:hypothetical protein [Methylicorpusculum sp.]MDZ4154591.1 hypothetical protein [Methylicorpusculum sp.]